MKTIEERTEEIINENSRLEHQKWDITTYNPNLEIAGNKISFWLRSNKEGGYAEVVSNMFWSEIVTIRNGRVSWSSGPSNIAGSSKQVAMIMKEAFNCIVRGDLV